MTTAIGPEDIVLSSISTTATRVPRGRSDLTVRELLLELTALQEALREQTQASRIDDLVHQQALVVRELRRRRGGRLRG